MTQPDTSLNADIPCHKRKKHPLRKYMLFFNQKRYLDESIVKRREDILRDALTDAKMVVASTEYKDIWEKCKRALEMAEL